MATTYHDNVFDNGLSYISANATTLRVVDGYTHGDSLATASAATVASATINSGNFAALASITNGRRLTLNGGISLGNATANASGNLHYVLDNGTIIIAAGDCPDQAITSGNPVTSGAVNFDLTFNPAA